MDARLGMLWLTTVFELETAAIRPLPRLLILDGHGSHVTYEFIEHCVHNSILLLCLPSHSTHLIQPLDVGLFGPYQHYYGQAVDKFMRSGQNKNGIKRSIFIPFLTQACERTFSAANIHKAFATTGIWPLCARRVLAKMTPDQLITARRDTFGIASPKRSQDIRQRVKAAEKILSEAMESLQISEESSGATNRKLVARVTEIMRELGHQLETEIAQGELYREQSRRLQGLDQIYNQTDTRKLSEARILDGATLIDLRD